MRIRRNLNALTAVFSLAAAPAFSQAMPTLTPPGSSTAIPLVPGATSAQIGNGMPPSIGDILSGTPTTPLSLRLGDLNGNWRRMTITGSVDLGTVTQMFTSLLGSAGVGVYYTQGQSLTLGNTTYLVAYRTQPKVYDVTSLIGMVQSAALSGKPPPVEKLTADTPLALTLLNLQSAGSLTDIKPFDLATEVAGSAAAAKALNDLINMMGTSDKPSSPPATMPHHPYRPKKKYPAT